MLDDDDLRKLWGKTRNATNLFLTPFPRNATNLFLTRMALS